MPRPALAQPENLSGLQPDFMTQLQMSLELVEKSLGVLVAVHSSSCAQTCTRPTRQLVTRQSL